VIHLKKDLRKGGVLAKMVRNECEVACRGVNKKRNDRLWGGPQGSNTCVLFKQHRVTGEMIKGGGLTGGER